MHAAVVEHTESFLINPESGQGGDPGVRLESVIIGTEGPRQARTESMNDDMAIKKRLPATRKHPVAKSRTSQFGDRAVVLQKECSAPQVRSVYGDESFFIERFACRREVNPDYLAKLEAKGLDFVGKGSTGKHGDVSS
jgi:CTP synthase (UTP-ammonia lyase)